MNRDRICQDKKEFLKLRRVASKTFAAKRKAIPFDAVLEKCFSRSRITGSDDPFISVVSAAAPRERWRNRNVSRLAFISVTVCGPATRYSATFANNFVVGRRDLARRQRTRCIVQARANCLFLQLVELSYRPNFFPLDASECEIRIERHKLRALDAMLAKLSTQH